MRRTYHLQRFGRTLCWGTRTVPGTAEALASGRRSRDFFVPATGRFFNAIPRAVQELPFRRYAIVMNGAVVWDRAEGRAIRRAELSPELAVRVMARLEDFPGTPNAI